MNKKMPRLIPVTKWKDYHPWPTLGALRNYIFLGESNGFRNVIVRVGGTILIDEEKFFQWVEKKNEESKK
jgi:hypothetical protein